MCCMKTEHCRKLKFLEVILKCSIIFMEIYVCVCVKSIISRWERCILISGKESSLGR